MISTRSALGLPPFRSKRPQVRGGGIHGASQRRASGLSYVKVLFWTALLGRKRPRRPFRGQSQIGLSSLRG